MTVKSPSYRVLSSDIVAFNGQRFLMQRFVLISEYINDNIGSVERTQLKCQIDRSLLAANDSEGVKECCAAEGFIFI